ncbi:MAG: UDP-glucose--hexose-1-phosphate uridylyltransferase, partial [Clostridiales bacterium]|nr:UDP-glucose--hexose-1-phosphate uridylyltransferase [Clostridiales bacterium]
MAMKIETVYAALDSLLDYAKECELLHPLDETFARNSLLAELKLESYEKQKEHYEFPECLNLLCDYAVENGQINDTIAERDLFDTRLMGCVTPRPSEVVRKFWSLYAESPKTATDYFYKLSQDCNYIRRDRIAKDEHWISNTPYGELEISINLSKPEKDPRDIAAAKLKKASGYPKCLLCVENVGYAGTISHPARQNLRVMPVTVNGQPWGFQYSPYVYYNEHAIVMNTQHTPMVIDRSAFDKLFSFVEQFPHYFLGSNADLPIVGGSILAHEHFQGGHHTFPMEKAEKEFGFALPGFEDVDCCVVKYPMTVLRLNSENKNQLCELAGRILAKWRAYSDPDAMIFAETDGDPHNTITPIARMRDGRYELDL